MRHALLLAGLLLAAAGCDSASDTRSESGELRSGDSTLNSGEFFDEYRVSVDAGDRVTATITSTEFDPYLILQEPGGEQLDNDDCTRGDFTVACGTVTASEDGEVRVLVTSFEPGETGRYSVTIESGSGSSRMSAPAPAAKSGAAARALKPSATR